METKKKKYIQSLVNGKVGMHRWPTNIVKYKGEDFLVAPFRKQAFTSLKSISEYGIEYGIWRIDSNGISNGLSYTLHTQEEAKQFVNTCYTIPYVNNFMESAVAKFRFMLTNKITHKNIYITVGGFDIEKTKRIAKNGIQELGFDKDIAVNVSNIIAQYTMNNMLNNVPCAIYDEMNLLVDGVRE